VLLLLVAGFLVKQVCAVTGLSRRAIEKIRERWKRSNFRGLQDRCRSGRRPKVVLAIRRLIVKSVRTSPMAYGYGLTVWTTARLAQHIAKETGIRLSARRVAQILAQEGFTFGSPAHTLKGKRPERAHRRAKRQLRVLKNVLSGPRPACASCSETSPASTSIRI
jgi:transposase